MANVLPIKDRTTLQRNYWLRLVITFSFTVTIAMTIGLVSLVPSYLSVKSQLIEVTLYNLLQGDARKVDKKDTSIQTARLVNAQIGELDKVTSIRPTHVVELMMRDWSVHAKRIIISGITYSSTGDTIQLRVSGESLDRSALNAFVQTLRSDTAFTDISFPVSDLVGDGALDFSITMQFQS